MATKREFAFLAGGIGIGIYGKKILSKTQVVSLGRYYKEVFAARNRLSKILIEEYYRIEEAIQTEETYLEMIKPLGKLSPTETSFTVTDDGKDRSIHLSVKLQGLRKPSSD